MKIFRSKQECIPQEKLCNLIDDCPANEDERFCFTLSNNIPKVDKLGIPKHEPIGYLNIRFNATWYLVANSNWTRDDSNKLCQKLQYESMKNLVFSPLRKLGYKNKCIYYHNSTSADHKEEYEKLIHIECNK